MDASEKSKPIPQFRSHKVVGALKIESVEIVGTDTTTDENPIALIGFGGKWDPVKMNLRGKPTPEAGWYFVMYPDGYISFSPGKAFEEGYTALESIENTVREIGTAHGIGWAVKQMHNGSRVRRSGWNGKGMFIFLVPGSVFKVNRAPLLGIYPEGTEINYHSHVDLKNSDGQIVPWNASQGDLLAVDWELAGN